VSAPVYVSRKVLAEKLGLTRQRVGQLIQQGKITETERGIDLERALADYRRNTDAEKVEQAKRRFLKVVDPEPAPAVPSEPFAQRHADPAPPIHVDEAGQGTLDFNRAKARKEHYNAELAQARLHQMTGALVSRDEIKAKEFTVARKLRDRILGWPARVASFVPPEAMRILTDEAEVLVREMQQDCASIAEAS
jgi:hypothetical protein